MSDSPPGQPEIERFVAPNPGPMTLEGTNTYVVGFAGASWVVDPGPGDAAQHIAAVREAAERRGEIAGVLLTHSHSDHSAAAAELGAPVVWGSAGTDDETSPPSGAGASPQRWPPEPPPEPIGPFRVIPTPGHAVDHVCLLYGRVCFSGDLILGRGPSFVPPDGGSLAAYLASLDRILNLDVDLLCPGHGPFVAEPRTKIDEYREHRLGRERKLLAALAQGVRSRHELLERAWDDVADELRPAAALVMQAHLEKLEAEGRVATDDLTD